MPKESLTLYPPHKSENNTGLNNLEGDYLKDMIIYLGERLLLGLNTFANTLDPAMGDWFQYCLITEMGIAFTFVGAAVCSSRLYDIPDVYRILSSAATVFCSKRSLQCSVELRRYLRGLPAMSPGFHHSPWWAGTTIQPLRPAFLQEALAYHQSFSATRKNSLTENQVPEHDSALDHTSTDDSVVPKGKDTRATGFLNRGIKRPFSLESPDYEDNTSVRGFGEHKVQEMNAVEKDLLNSDAAPAIFNAVTGFNSRTRPRSGISRSAAPSGNTCVGRSHLKAPINVTRPLDNNGPYSASGSLVTVRNPFPPFSIRLEDGSSRQIDVSYPPLARKDPFRALAKGGVRKATVDQDTGAGALPMYRPITGIFAQLSMQNKDNTSIPSEREIFRSGTSETVTQRGPTVAKVVNLFPRPLRGGDPEKSARNGSRAIVEVPKNDFPRPYHSVSENGESKDLQEEVLPEGGMNFVKVMNNFPRPTVALGDGGGNIRVLQAPVTQSTETEKVSNIFPRPQTESRAGTGNTWRMGSSSHGIGGGGGDPADTRAVKRVTNLFPRPPAARSDDTTKISRKGGSPLGSRQVSGAMDPMGFKEVRNLPQPADLGTVPGHTIRAEIHSRVLPTPEIKSTTKVRNGFPRPLA